MVLLQSNCDPFMFLMVFYYVELLTELFISGGLLLLWEPAPVRSARMRTHIDVQATSFVLIEAKNFPWDFLSSTWGVWETCNSTSSKIRSQEIIDIVLLDFCAF